MKIYASSNTNKPSVGFLIQQCKPPRYHSGRVLALSAGGPGLNIVETKLVYNCIKS